jgi:hypothetical protein
MLKLHKKYYIHYILLKFRSKVYEETTMWEHDLEVYYFAFFLTLLSSAVSVKFPKVRTLTVLKSSIYWLIVD